MNRQAPGSDQHHIEPRLQVGQVRLALEDAIEAARLEMDAAALWEQLEYLLPGEPRTAVAKEQ